MTTPIHSLLAASAGIQAFLSDGLEGSGLLLFYPFSLFLLLCIHSIFEGGLPGNRSKKRRLRRQIVTKTKGRDADGNTFLPES